METPDPPSDTLGLQNRCFWHPMTSQGFLGSVKNTPVSGHRAHTTFKALASRNRGQRLDIGASTKQREFDPGVKQPKRSAGGFRVLYLKMTHDRSMVMIYL